MRVAIIYYRLLDATGTQQLIGGVETYLLALGELCSDMGWEPVLFQLSSQPFERRLGKLRVVGVPAMGMSLSHQKRRLYEAALMQVDVVRDIIIYGADHCSVPVRSKRAIAIQHGVSWDLPTKYFTRKKILMSGLGASFKKYLVVREMLRNFNNCANRVCVDFNYFNWYRTQIGDEPKGRIWVIPNFCTAFASEVELLSRRSRKKTVDILFARRFASNRGVRIIIESAKELLRRYPQVTFTFAGEGPEERWMREELAGEDRVSFVKYLPHESLSVHARHDIAVIPSIASEGTSFSVAEAMGAGCAVVATGVGGITNMLIDGYNGLLVMPDHGSVLEGMERLIEDPQLRLRLGEKAWETANSAFSLVRWRARWRAVLEETANG